MRNRLLGKARFFSQLVCLLACCCPLAYSQEQLDTLREIAELKARLGRLEASVGADPEVRRLNVEDQAGPLDVAAFQGDKPVEKPAAKPAEKKSEEKQHYEVGTDLVFKPRFKDGLYFETANQDYKAHVGGLIQQDWAYFAQPAALQAAPPGGVGNLQDAIFFRRGRLKFDGVLHEVMEWDLDVELIANTQVAFDDLWVGFTQIPWIGNVRVGHVKIPLGIESVTSNRVFTFTERATIFDTFAPEYGPGMLAFDSVMNGRATWAACYHRLDANGTGTDFGDGEYNGTVRGTWLPYCTDDDRQYLHIGSACSSRAARSGQVRFRTRPEWRDTTQVAALNNRFIDTGNINADGFNLYQAEMAVINGPLSFQTEFIYADITGASVGPNNLGHVGYNGGYAMVSYFLTGESRTYDHRLGRFARVRPTSQFWGVVRNDPSEPRSGLGAVGSGAWEIAGRYSWVDLNNSGVNGGKLDGYTVGLNWYLNYNCRVQWDYIASQRNVSAPGADGLTHAFVMRLSLDM